MKGSIMKKDKTISKILKIISVGILLYGLWIFYDWRLWREALNSTLATELKILLPILTFGFSGSLYGIATLLEKK